MPSYSSSGCEVNNEVCALRGLGATAAARLFPPLSSAFHAIHLSVLSPLSHVLSQSASPPTCLIGAVEVKTNRIDQPGYRRMDARNRYWWMDDGRRMTVGEEAEAGIWRGLLKCHDKRCIGPLCFPSRPLLVIRMICVAQ